ncbi:hypothetical protein UPYG_G00080120, partial [Umbra pygmaea]
MHSKLIQQRAFLSGLCVCYSPCSTGDLNTVLGSNGTLQFPKIGDGIFFQLQGLGNVFNHLTFSGLGLEKTAHFTVELPCLNRLREPAYCGSRRTEELVFPLTLILILNLIVRNIHP